VARVSVTAGLVLLAWTASATAQIAPAAPETLAIGDWQLVPILEVRVRGEYTFDLDSQNRGFLVERARLGANVERGIVRARVSLQDARSWNVEGGTDPIRQLAPIAQTGAYEAWAEAHTTSAVPSFVRVGRQAVSWGEGRLLGIADWSAAGRSLDALRGRLSVGDGAFELLAASLTDSSAGNLLSAYGQLLGARAQWAFHPLFSGEAYVLIRLAQVNPPAPLSLDGTVRGQTYTGALRAYGDAWSWAWGVEGAYQLGRVEELNEDRAAWAAVGHVAHTFERIALEPRLGLAVSYASGDSGGSTYRAFDPLLPDVHVWHGAMDLFSWSNEGEVSARVAAVPWTDALASVEYRYARLAQPGGTWRSAYLTAIGPSPARTNTQADLGHEIDAVLTWSPWVPVELTAGYSVLLLGSGARAILALSPGSPPSASHFAYAQATLRMF
jgi:hypothetical protein